MGNRGLGGGLLGSFVGVGVVSLYLPFCIYSFLHLSLIRSSLLEVHGVFWQGCGLSCLHCTVSISFRFPVLGVWIFPHVAFCVYGYWGFGRGFPVGVGG